MRGPDKLSTDLVSAVRSDMHALCQMAPGELSGGGVVVLCGVGERAVAVTGYNLRSPGCQMATWRAERWRGGGVVCCGGKSGSGHWL